MLIIMLIIVANTVILPRIVMPDIDTLYIDYIHGNHV
jgi:hypothetical protein